MTLKIKNIGTNTSPLPPKSAANAMKASGDDWLKVNVRGKPGEEDHVFTVKKYNKKYFWYDVNGAECFNPVHDHLSYRVAQYLPKNSVYNMVRQENVPEQLNCWKFDNQLEAYFKGRRNIVSSAIIPIEFRERSRPVR